VAVVALLIPRLAGDVDHIRVMTGQRMVLGREQWQGELRLLVGSMLRMRSMIVEQRLAVSLILDYLV
jgi:hypothetical protein